MTTPVVTDVFKFLAVRPAQRLSPSDAAVKIVEDGKAATADGKRELAKLARNLSRRDTALEHWRALDLSPIEPLVNGREDLLQRYALIGPSEDPPDAASLLEAAGLSGIADGVEPRVVALAWEALYTGHATGRDAGHRLERPIAALQIIHFARIVRDDPRPARSIALDALSATIVIPDVFQEALRAEPPPALSSPVAPQNPSATVSLDETRRSVQIRALATDLVATERLLAAVSNPPAIDAIMVRHDSADSDAADRSGRFSVSTTPSVADALPTHQLSRAEAAVLGQLRIADATLAPAAAQTLQAHFQSLSDQAAVLADDLEFRTAMETLSGVLSVTTAALAAKPPGTTPTKAPDVDVSGRITPLGIGDLKVVKQTLLAYVAGEVAHIENVLKGEAKTRTHRKLDRTETTLFTSDEETTDTERDTQTTDRFELKREAENTIKEDTSVKAGLTVTASYGPVVATASGEFAYAASKQDSVKTSANYAREVVDKSVHKVQTKTKTERTTKTLNEVEEINQHSLKNDDPTAANVTGIYRWVDKRYRAQVYNYGVRLLLEFVLPEPAAYYRAARQKAVVEVHGEAPPPFVKVPAFNVEPGSVELGVRGARPEPLIAGHITEVNYLKYAARYGASGIKPPPSLFTYVGIAIAPKKDEVGQGKAAAIVSAELKIPVGYEISSYGFTVSAVYKDWAKLSVQVRADSWTILNVPGSDTRLKEKQIGDLGGTNVKVEGTVPVSVACYDVGAFALNVQAVCKRTDSELTKWKISTYEAIQSAYLAMKTAYDQKATQAESALGISIEGENPALNRKVEAAELKKLCITMMSGQHFDQFGAMTEPAGDPTHPPEVNVYKALDDGPIIQFFEQAFEWEQMTYLLYPYFWGRKTNWSESVNLSDPDPMFQQFLTAGAARVLVPVPLAYVKDVLYLLQNPMKDLELGRKVWGGGPTVTLKDDRYLSIVDEMKNQTDDLDGAKPEGPSWEFTLPTTLVWLQPDDKLPTF